MISNWLKMRFMQGFRAIRSVGALLLLIALPLFVIFVLGLLARIQTWNPYYWAAIIPLVILFLHLSRKDGKFLKLNFSKKEIRQLMMAEYTIAAVPIYLLIGFALKNWWPMLFGQAAIFLIAFLPLSRKSILERKTFLPLGWIPADLYEWRMAFRKYGVLLILIWLIGVLGFWFVGGTMVSILLFTFIMTSMFEDLENKEMLLSRGNPKTLAGRKSLRHFQWLNLVFLPHHVLFLALYSQYWYVWLAVVLISGAIISFAIFKKYSSWMPKRQRVYSSTQVGLFCLFGLVPFFWPVAIAWFIIFYRKANKRMRYLFQ